MVDQGVDGGSLDELLSQDTGSLLWNVPLPVDEVLETPPSVARLKQATDRVGTQQEPHG